MSRPPHTSGSVLARAGWEPYEREIPDAYQDLLMAWDLRTDHALSWRGSHNRLWWLRTGSGDEVILKTGGADELQQEWLALRSWSRVKAPVIVPRAAALDEEAAALLLNAVHVPQNAELFLPYEQTLALARSLPALSLAGVPLLSARLAERSAGWQENADVLKEAGIDAAELAALRQHAERMGALSDSSVARMLHGALRPEHALNSGAGVLIAPQPVHGDPAYDIAMLAVTSSQEENLLTRLQQASGPGLSLRRLHRWALVVACDELLRFATGGEQDGVTGEELASFVHQQLREQP